MNERELDILNVEVEAYILKLLEEYTNNWIGDRRDYGDVYNQAGRYPGENSQGLRGNDLRDFGRESGSP
jgi:hypothetical protein